MDWIDNFPALKTLEEEYMEAMRKAVADGKIAVLVNDGKVVATYGPEEFFAGFETSLSFGKNS
jgi:hypothetical protein